MTRFEVHLNILLFDWCTVSWLIVSAPGGWTTLHCNRDRIEPKTLNGTLWTGFCSTIPFHVWHLAEESNSVVWLPTTCQACTQSLCKGIKPFQELQSLTRVTSVQFSITELLLCRAFVTTSLWGFWQPAPSVKDLALFNIIVSTDATGGTTNGPNFPSIFSGRRALCSLQLSVNLDVYF